MTVENHAERVSASRKGRPGVSAAKGIKIPFKE